MADGTHIEWTEATWNPIVGCSLASPGCTNCYAMQFAGTRLAHTAKYDGLTREVNGNHVWTGKLAFDEKALLEPLRWKKPRMIFVNSMGDLFHEDCTDEMIDRVFAVMALCPQHTFQVLTKRSGRMREYCISRFGGWGEMLLTDAIEALGGFENDAGGEWGKPLPNVWLGVSVEDQQRADERIPDLLATPAAIRWISAEPLLGPVDLGQCLPEFERLGWSTYLDSLDWVVAGGESGKGARPMHPDWARSLRDQCAAAGVPFFFKQWGEWYPAFANDLAVHASAVREEREIEGEVIYRLGKKQSGRLLDGTEHNGMPGDA